MKKFAGEWFLTPIYSPDDANTVIGVRALLEQDLLPTFVPFFCAGFMKNVSKRAIQRIVEDINIFAERYHSGVSFEELLKPKKGKHEHIESDASVSPEEAFKAENLQFATN